MSAGASERGDGASTGAEPWLARLCGPGTVAVDGNGSVYVPEAGASRREWLVAIRRRDGQELRVQRLSLAEAITEAVQLAAERGWPE